MHSPFCQIAFSVHLNKLEYELCGWSQKELIKMKNINRWLRCVPLLRIPAVMILAVGGELAFLLIREKMKNMAERNIAMTDRKDSISIKNLPSDLREK